MYSVAKVAAITYRLWCRFDRLLRAKLVQAYLLLFAGQTAVSRRNRRATLGIARNDAAMHVGQAEIAFPATSNSTLSGQQSRQLG